VLDDELDIGEPGRNRARGREPVASGRAPDVLGAKPKTSDARIVSRIRIEPRELNGSAKIGGPALTGNLVVRVGSGGESPKLQTMVVAPPATNCTGTRRSPVSGDLFVCWATVNIAVRLPLSSIRSWRGFELLRQYLLAVTDCDQLVCDLGARHALHDGFHQLLSSGFDPRELTLSGRQVSPLLHP
jgi:hypothetical protein